MDRPAKTLETKFKVAEMVRKLTNRREKRALIASTSEVYGRQGMRLDVPPGRGHRPAHGRRDQTAVSLRLFQRLMAEPRAMGQVINVRNTEELIIICHKILRASLRENFLHTHLTSISHS
jgi:hypothetical protein